MVFIATAEPRDAEMVARIAHHQAERPEEWTTINAPLDLAEALTGAPERACVIVDCLSLWVSNLLERDEEGTIAPLAVEAARCAAGRPAPTIAVSNEVGMGIVPANELARRYRDVLGRVNAIWADHATESALVIAGRQLSLGTEEDGA
ncbi:MAG: adenosylcobinamide kinase / adenosylcobinamide-phosphate guanylyltransferase [Solirubrobacterales bacterium]|nr:adenosylcobinamide kinase / adenosylcobinamide-phosphate guanylyltransferase [Solirubrobacterales bacterium]